MNIDIAYEIGLPGEAVDEMRRAYETILASCGKSVLDEAKRVLFSGSECGALLEEAAGKCALRADMVKLVFCFYALEESREIYRAKGFSEDVFMQSLTDITIWAKVAKKYYGGWGMHEFEWVCRTLRSTVVRMGRLQFEPNVFKSREYTLCGRTLHRGDPVLNVHIPEGEPMPKEARTASYRQAADFFGNDVFVCESYLLWPRQRDFLKKDSNILSFMDDFETVYSCPNSGHDLWRIFGVRDSFDPKELPRETSLQRAYAEMLEADGGIGSGYGVMIFGN